MYSTVSSYDIRKIRYEEEKKVKRYEKLLKIVNF